ncbi:hypothetical protein [Chitinophaga qingshengii]|uniref:Uncharacterized protein n=1 Tax=Chitinophaga qingshengii TaxID=1569794 RepID=A0ABR7TJB4_9BACT|nr:hypothetical protein [Chitinophaga qingshengii]MBC9930587.1 hypothetical protein [Chitinophaga qingshengii]
MMKKNNIQRWLPWLMILWLLLSAAGTSAQGKVFRTMHASFTIDGRGYITSIKDKRTGKEYCPAGMSSPLLCLYKDKQWIYPVKAIIDGALVKLTYTDGSIATIKSDEKKEYLRLQLVAVDNRSHADNIVWGPYKTNISKTIGEIISVVRDDHFAIGMMALNDNTTSGPPTDGDMGFMYYYIHSPDPVKYPLPPHLKEGQTFKIGGDGISDIAFYSQPEEYFRMCYGDGARLEPSFGSTICLHSRDRRKEQMIRYPVLPDNLDGGFNSARYQLVEPTDADFNGSAIALYACPDQRGLATIERIVLNEGLPHPESDGIWIKDPRAFKPDIAWWGAHDSLASYAAQLGLQAVQDEGWGEYYPNPANRWGKKKISFAHGPAMSIPDFGRQMKTEGVRYGLHTLCEFLQPDNNSDVAPVPSDSLAIMQRTTLAHALSPNDTMIMVTDTAYFNEFGGWEGNHTNVLKIGKELIEYNGITTTPPYTFLHVNRGFHGTVKGTFPAGTTVVKLQPNCYRGFAPNMDLQEDYAGYYGRWLTEGHMDYIDFDGLESCIYQGHGQYSFKRFFRKLFDTYRQTGGDYLRVMGSCVYEGNWHYMSVCNVGGGDHMFDPVHNKWGIEGKDMRYVFESNYFPATFGIMSYSGSWSLYDAENLQAKSIGWNATYMLGLSQETVESSGEKQAIFRAFRDWQDARAAGMFNTQQREKLKDLRYKYHLERNGEGSYILYTLKERRFPELRYGHSTPLRTGVPPQARVQELAIRMTIPEKSSVAGLVVRLSDNTEIQVDHPLTNGQCIIFRNGAWQLTDKNRKVLSALPVKRKTVAGNGMDTITLEALQPANDAVKMELVATYVVSSEKVNK